MLASRRTPWPLLEPAVLFTSLRGQARCRQPGPLPGRCAAHPARRAAHRARCSTASTTLVPSLALVSQNRQLWAWGRAGELGGGPGPPRPCPELWLLTMASFCPWAVRTPAASGRPGRRSVLFPTSMSGSAVSAACWSEEQLVALGRTAWLEQPLGLQGSALFGPGAPQGLAGPRHCSTNGPAGAGLLLLPQHHLGLSTAFPREAPGLLPCSTGAVGSSPLP